jgi:photosystem II stability/assembly factor-like uncharacterized protein
MYFLDDEGGNRHNSLQVDVVKVDFINKTINYKLFGGYQVTDPDMILLNKAILADEKNAVFLLATNQGLFSLAPEVDEKAKLIYQGNFTCFEVNPNNPNMIWVGGKGLIILSEDAGKSWKKISGFGKETSENN